MPKGRYAIMRRYMPKLGTLGLDMMLRTCTVQANLDFASEADMVKKFRLALALQPVATALFANSPFTEGKPNGFKSHRAQVWTDTDPDRTGMLAVRVRGRHSASSAMSITRSMCRCISSIATANISTPRASRSATSWSGKLPALPGETADDERLGRPPDHRLSRSAPEEISRDARRRRRPRRGSARCRLSGPASVRPARARCRLGSSKDWTPAEREALRREVPKTGLKTRFRAGTVRDLAVRMVEIARVGLKARNRRDGKGRDETLFLETLLDIAKSGETPADNSLPPIAAAGAAKSIRSSKKPTDRVNALADLNYH